LSFLPATIDYYCVVGTGDPTTTTGDLSKALYWIPMAKLRSIGTLYLNTEAWKGTAPDDWELRDFVWDFGAQATTLIVNQNSFQIKAFPWAGMTTRRTNSPALVPDAHEPFSP